MTGRVTITGKCGHSLGVYAINSSDVKAVRSFVKSNARHLRKRYGKIAIKVTVK